MLNIYTIDDDYIQLKLLTDLVEENFKQINIETNILMSEKIDDKVLYEMYDLYFLDIEIGKESGINLALAIKRKYPKAIIVFVSSHDNYVFDSFEAQPFYFIRKSSLETDLKKCINKFRIIKRSANSYIWIRRNNNVCKIFLDDIMYIDAYNGQLNIIKFDSSEEQCRDSLAEIYLKVDKDSFDYANRSTLVNFKYVKYLGNNYVVLENNRKVEISRRNVKNFKDKFFNYIKRY